VVLAVGLELLGRLLGSRGLTLVAAGVIGTLVAAALLTPRIGGATVRFELPARLTAGVESIVGLRLTAPARRGRSVGPFLVTDRSPAYAGTTVVAPALRSGRSAVATFSVRPAHRGHWPASTVTVEAVSPLGGFVRRGTVSIPVDTWVHPAPARLLPLHTVGSHRTPDGARSRTSPTGSEIGGLREWQAGDPAGRVHWRASARRNQIVVMERDDNRQPAVLVAAGRSDGSDAWEYAVARCAATAVEAVRAGHNVVLLTADETFSARSARDLLDRFAALHEPAAPSPAVITRSLRQAGPGAVLIWLSTDPTPAEVSVAARAASAVVVTVLPTHDREPGR
jgi:uncharacterized protein (DUF58 family)